MPVIISLSHQKGGVGKTTLTLNLYDYYIRNGLKCAIVDADVQGSIQEAVVVLGEQEDWATMNIIEMPEEGKWERLHDYSEYNIILIDTPPYLSHQLPDIFAISDFVLIPCKASPLDALAINQTIDLVKESMEENPGLRAGIVMNMVYHSTDFNDKVESIVAEHGLPVFKSKIANRVAYSKSLFITRSVLGENDKKAKEEIANLGTELLNVLNE